MFLDGIMDYVFTMAVIGILFFACYIGFYKSFLPNLIKFVLSLALMLIPIACCVILMDMGSGEGGLLGLHLGISEMIPEIPFLDKTVTGLLNENIVGEEFAGIKLEGDTLVFLCAVAIPLIIFVVLPLVWLCVRFLTAIIANIFTPVVHFKPIKVIDRILCVLFYFCIGCVIVLIVGIIFSEFMYDEVCNDPTWKGFQAISEYIGEYIESLIENN